MQYESNPFLDIFTMIILLHSKFTLSKNNSKKALRCSMRLKIKIFNSLPSIYAEVKYKIVF